jgi:glycosyltransferase involved in cell wall biosynthesis
MRKSGAKRLSVIVSWRDRGELGRALPTIAACAAAHGGEVLVVCFGGDRRDLDAQIGSTPGAAVLEIGNQAYFNKPKAMNLGARHSRGRILFFCDCDILLDPVVFGELLHKVESTPDAFGTLAHVKETELNSRRARFIASFGYELRLKTADNRQVRIVDHEEDAETGLRMAPGLLLVRRESFEMVNGYNSQLDGWGWEDQDMICRLTLGAGLTRINYGRALHISHDDNARVQGLSAKDRWESRDRMFRRALANYDEANFQGTYAEDNHALGHAIARDAGSPAMVSS